MPGATRELELTMGGRTGWSAEAGWGQGRTKLLMTPALSTIHPDPHLTANSIFAFLFTSFNVSLFEINH